ncbi:RICIN domain-containing protein [Nostoc sp. CCY 9925]|uniref:RICIN domain-containing protein n=1 Tax=Nostoc sp. CCY 9925 TaxID=3103865 RepID=UPI0039C6CA1A
MPSYQNDPIIVMINILLRARGFGLYGLFAAGLLAAVPSSVLLAATPTNDLMLINVQTGKCLTIAGGVSTQNNVEALQFDCDNDPSRTWRITDVTGAGVYQIRNVQTNKCLTIAGGRSTENNVTALQYNCDSDPSRTWRITDVTGAGVYQIRNVQTNKCLTIAGGRSTENNVTVLQYNCDSDPSRTWTLRVKL